MSWKEHKNRWKDCDACPLHKTRRKVVLARGTVPCDVLFIGEAPGVSENVLGKPFVGPAGKLLDRIIEESVTDPLNYAITNLISCIPYEINQITGKKTGVVVGPSKQSIDACRPRLSEFVDLCSPRLIVLVGVIAQNYPPITDTPMVGIMHPAAILRMNVVARPLEIKKAVIEITDALESL